MKAKQLLAELLPAGYVQAISAHEVVGDIAIVNLPTNLLHLADLIGQAILASNKRIKVVARRDGQYAGEYRTVPLVIIAGEQRKETEHREFGIRLRLNPEKVYFSPRSGGERRRIAGLVQPDEDVLVLFSGIAPYPLILSAHSKARTIVGIEKNPLAHGYALANLALNRKCANISLLCGDVLTLLPALSGVFDRIVMPLPGDGDIFLANALAVLRPGGHLHFYDFQPPRSFAQAIARLDRACQEIGRQLNRAEVWPCGHCAPRLYRVCVDGEIG